MSKLKSFVKTKKMIYWAVGILSTVLLTCSFFIFRHESVKENKVKDISEKLVSNTEAKKLVSKPVKETSEYTDVERPTLDDIKKAPKEINKNAYLGSIDIDDLAIHTNVFKNLDQQTNSVSMLQGVMEGLKEQSLGESNYVLLGHNLGYKNVLFSDLVHAKKGMEIKVTVKDIVKTFKVIDIKTVKNTDTNVFNMSKKPKLTLITCDVATATNKRVVVTAELIK